MVWMVLEKTAHGCLFRQQKLSNINVLAGQGAKLCAPAIHNPRKLAA
jgi:hypothetical protein